MKPDKPFRLSWKGGLALLGGTLLIAWLSDHFGRFDLAAPTAYSMAALCVAIALNWRLKRHVWFWAAMVAIVALHIPLILYVPWTTRWIPALVVTPILAVELAVINTILKLLEKQFEEASVKGSLPQTTGFNNHHKHKNT